jgi:AAA family ATP:ADP antiporter
MPPDVRSSASEPRTLVTHPELKSHQSFPFFKTIGEAPKGALDRLLSLFADVRAGEGVGALLLALNVFLLLAGYSMLKPGRDALALEEVGPEVTAYLGGIQAVLLAGVIPLYGWIASRVPRMRLITITFVFFASNLVLFYLAGQAGLRIGATFFIWIGIFNVFVISQIWAFANDIYTEGQGRRLFPMIGVGASLGAWVGAASIVPLVRNLQVTPYTMMLAVAPILVLCLAITFLVNRRETTRAEPGAARADVEPLGRQGGFELIAQDRYLLWMAVLAVLLNFVNTTGGYVLNSLLNAEALSTFGTDPGAQAARVAFRQSFLGSVGSTVNLLGFLLQLFAASRVIRFMGVRGALFILPVVAMINYSIIAVVPLLAVVRIGKILENSTDYSIQNTVRQALFLPTSRESKYKAKAAIDTFFMRGGDALAALFVKAGTSMGVAAGTFAWVNVGFTAAWLLVAGQIAREHRRRTL